MQKTIIRWVTRPRTDYAGVTTEVTYKVTPEDTYYHKDTPDELIDWLERARVNEWRVRLFYGDRETGRDWLEENDVTGRLGRTMGPMHGVILLHSSRSTGGGMILDDSIVKLIMRTPYGLLLWQAPNYQRPEFCIDYSHLSERWEVRLRHSETVHARFDSKEKAERYVEFMLGLRMSK